MLLKKLIVVAVVLASMQGCALNKPPLDAAGYDSLVTQIVMTQRCTEAGYMSPDMGALGMHYLVEALNSYTYDDQTFGHQLSSKAQTLQPTIAQCNNMAMLIASVRDRIAANNQAAQASQQAWQQYQNSLPKYTFCKQVGTQTFCTTQ